MKVSQSCVIVSYVSYVSYVKENIEGWSRGGASRGGDNSYAYNSPTVFLALVFMFTSTASSSTTFMYSSKPYVVLICGAEIGGISI
jgi:hypothetical protein